VAVYDECNYARNGSHSMPTRRPLRRILSQKLTDGKKKQQGKQQKKKKKNDHENWNINSLPWYARDPVQALLRYGAHVYAGFCTSSPAAPQRNPATLSIN